MGLDLQRAVAALRPDALADRGWSGMLEILAKGLDASGASLFSVRPAAGVPQASCGCARDSLADYIAQWAGQDEWFAALQRRGLRVRAGQAVRGSEVLSAQELRRTAFHADFLRPQGIEHLVSLRLTDEDDEHAPLAHLSFYRPDSREDFAQEERQALGALWPQLQQALRREVMTARAAALGAVEETLQVLDQPAWVLRADAWIEFMNPPAHRLVADPLGVRMVAGRLSGVGDVGQEELREALSRVSVAGSCRRVACLGSERAGAAVLQFAGVGAVPSFVQRWPRAQALLMVRLPADDELRAQWRARMATRHRLTPAEFRVLLGLLEGESPASIADRLGVSRTTVRTQLRALFAKTGCTRQADLVRAFGCP